MLTFWRQDCVVQQLYVVISVLSMIYMGVVLFWVNKAYDEAIDASASTAEEASALRRSKWIVMLYIALSTIVSWILSIILLNWYCNQGLSGWKNVLGALGMYFVVLSVVHVVVYAVFSPMLLNVTLPPSVMLPLRPVQ